ncbi:MAG: zinc metallopeptidase [Gammaproteobacteria bacterium]|nr:zinc metallopeptidase [Gammaproteobacteria bacterium]
MHFVFITLLILLVVFGPQLWARYIFSRYSKPMSHIPGTGGELAVHLLERFKMEEVKVEKAEKQGDHYDPFRKVVCLSVSNHDDNSLTAIAVAAHEVGHAIQHHRDEAMLKWRTRLAMFAMVVQKIGAAAMLAMPIVMGITRAPISGVYLAAIGLGSMLVATLVHLVTLPVEIDASFGKALPVLKEGQYIQPEDETAVRRILTAAALTYVAASLASLLNLWRWIRILRP